MLFNNLKKFVTNIYYFPYIFNPDNNVNINFFNRNFNGKKMR